MNDHEIRQYKKLVGQYASGVTIVAGISKGNPVGFTCQSFHSISIDPQLISISIMKASTSWPLIRPSGHFSVNILTQSQSGLSDRFSRSGEDKWRDQEWQKAGSASPVLPDALFWLDCRLFAEHDAGDHTIAIGQVTDMSEMILEDQKKPLVYFRGRYHALQAESL